MVAAELAVLGRRSEMQSHRGKCLRERGRSRVDKVDKVRSGRMKSREERTQERNWPAVRYKDALWDARVGE